MSATRPKPTGSVVAAVVAMAAAAVAIAAVRPGLVDRTAKVHETTDAYPLPPPEQLPVVSLGYRAAAADLIWAYVLVAQGLRLGEHRRFEYAARYLESIFTLDPTYREPYLMIDTIVSFGAKKARVEDVRAARRLFELGIANRPYDAQLYLEAGNFIAYIAPPILDDENEKKEWRVFGAKLLERAEMLGSGSEMVRWHALMGARMLSRTGERAAAIDFLERTYRITEDEDLRQQILLQLRALDAEDAAARAKASVSRFEDTWRSELPFVSRAMILLLGPRTDTWACAGSATSRDPRCIRDWATWTARETEAPR